MSNESPARDKAFEEQLAKIGGTNRFGNPRLRVVWGGTELSDRTKSGTELKYHIGWTTEELKGWRYDDEDGTHFIEDANEYTGTALLKPVIEQSAVGYPRWIIEKWVSPEELEAQKRFKGNTKVLRDFPREGVYEPYFIVEDSESNFRPLGRDVLDFIKLKWDYEHNVSYENREFERRDYMESLEKEKQERQAEIMSFDAHMRLPDEEIDRRNLMEENARKAKGRAEAEAKKLTFYGSSTSTKDSAESANR